jgi:hypothetical protein
MAISLARARRVGQQRTTSKKLAKEYGAQQKRAQKRKGISGLLGKGLGMGLGSLLGGALGIASGGLLMPLVMAAGSFGGKKLAHEMTRGMGAKTGGLKGDMYGYGEEEAMSLKKDLKSQMAVDPLKEHGGFGKDLLSSYVSAGMKGNLGSVGKAIKGKGSLAQSLMGGEGAAVGTGKGLLQFGDIAQEGVDEFGDPFSIGATPFKFGSSKDVGEGAKASFGDLFGQEWGQSKEELTGEEYLTEPESWWEGAQGGQVPQQQLMALLALAQMQQNNAYSGTALEEEEQPSIANYFESKGKTLGGNNTQSLSQMLGR